MLRENTLIQNRYLVRKMIGRGGMGAVYLAEDTRFDNRMIALKEMLHSNSQQLNIAFEREANLLAQLQHARLPKVSDFFNENGYQYLVMEYIPGDDLWTILEKRGKPFETIRVLRWADGLLEILEYLHAKNPPIVHRDIKPQNLKLRADDRIILIDFGLAKDTLTHLSRLTASNSLIGFTPNYAPLEQIKGDHTTPQTDLYAFSATVYHLLTNTAPETSLSRIQAKVDETPDPLVPAHRINPEIPPKLSALLTRGLSLKRESRPLSATEMRLAIKEISEDLQKKSAAQTEQIAVNFNTNGNLPQIQTPIPTQAGTGFIQIPSIQDKSENYNSFSSVPFVAPNRFNFLNLGMILGAAAFLLLGIATAYFIGKQIIAKPLPTVVEAQAKPETENPANNIETVSAFEKNGSPIEKRQESVINETNKISVNTPKQKSKPTVVPQKNQENKPVVGQQRPTVVITPKPKPNPVINKDISEPDQ